MNSADSASDFEFDRSEEDDNRIVGAIVNGQPRLLAPITSPRLPQVQDYRTFYLTIENTVQFDQIAVAIAPLDTIAILVEADERRVKIAAPPDLGYLCY
jgi:hypothetical protein